MAWGSRNPPASLQTQRGMALLLVLMLLAFMSGLAVIASERWFFNFNYSLQLHQQLQGKWMAAGAESLAKKLLQQDRQSDGLRTHLSQRWATMGSTFRLEDAQLQPQLRDAQACFNLNAVAANEQVEKMFSRLQVVLGEDRTAAQRISAALAEWLDEDDISRKEGAEEDDYPPRRSPLLTAGQRLQDISELRQIRGVSAGLLQRLRPLVCALPEKGLNINLNTLQAAQWPLLAALTETEGEATFRQLLARRPEAGWHSLSEPLAVLASLEAGRPYLSLDSNYFTLQIRVQLADTSFQQISLLQRQGGQVNVLQRHWEMDAE